MAAAKSISCPKCYSRLHAPRHSATVVCPSCWHSWGWMSSAPTTDSFWKRNGGVVAWVLILTVALGGRWWWVSQSRALADARTQLEQADRARSEGDLTAADRHVGQVGRSVDAATPLFPTLRGVRAEVRERLTEQQRKLTAAHARKAEWSALVAKFKAAADALEDAETAVATRRLEELRAERERVGREQSATFKADRDAADDAATSLTAKIEDTKTQAQTLTDAGKRLADARNQLAAGKLATSERLLTGVADDLRRAADWKAVAKIGKERDGLTAAANALRGEYKAAYRKLLDETLQKAQTLLTAKTFDEAKKHLKAAQEEIGTDDVVLAEALKQAELAAGKEEWTDEDDRRLAKMPEEADGWKKVRGTDTRDAYKSYLRDNPKGAFAAAAEARLVDMEVAEQKKGKFSPLPDIRPDRFDPLLKSSMTTVKNDTPYTLTVLYSGTESKRVVLTAGGSETVSMAAGYYTISASVSASNVVPFIGSRTVGRGDVMTESFYIKSQTRTDPFSGLPGIRVPGRLTDPFR